jgi:malonyl-CoA O-methyltransferase
MSTHPVNSAVNSTSVRAFDLGRVVRALRQSVKQDAPPWLHQEVARRMAQRLELIKLQPAVLLDWWGFSGASHAVLAQAYPQAQRWVLEPTPELRTRAKNLGSRSAWWKLGRLGATLPCVLAPQEVLPQSVNLVWANMMLHAVADPPRTFQAWHQAVDVDGFVMFSCLGPGSLRVLEALYQRLDWGPPMAQFVDMHDLGDMLVQAGFADPVMDQELITLSWPDAQALLNELRSLGGNASPQRFQGLRTPRWHAALLRELGALQGEGGRIDLSFEVVYGHAFKAAPRIQIPGQTIVSLDEMRALVRGK